MKRYLVLGKYVHTKIGIDNLYEQLYVIKKSIPKQKEIVTSCRNLFEEALDEQDRLKFRKRELDEMIESITEDGEFL